MDKPKTYQTVNIHGKDYLPVSERVRMAGNDIENLYTEILTDDDEKITVIAKIQIKERGWFFGHAASFKSRGLIEKQSPLEVAETSAIGRALGFAGYGIVEGIATADGVKKATVETVDDLPTRDVKEETTQLSSEQIDEVFTGTNPDAKCPECGTTGKYHSFKCSRRGAKVD